MRTYLIQYNPCLLINGTEKVNVSSMVTIWLFSNSTLSLNIYLLTVKHTIIGDSIHAIYGSLICGLMLHMCCQIEILNYRLKSVVQNPEILRSCVIHHNFLMKFVLTINITWLKTFLFCNYNITNIRHAYVT